MRVDIDLQPVLLVPPRPPTDGVPGAAAHPSGLDHP